MGVGDVDCFSVHCGVVYECEGEEGILISLCRRREIFGVTEAPAAA